MSTVLSGVCGFAAPWSRGVALNVRPSAKPARQRIQLPPARGDYKKKVKASLSELGHDVRDFGTHANAAVDYPAFIRPAAEAVARGEWERGIVFGGSGNGETIVANKVRGIRWALCWSLDTARWSREHNDANVLAIGQRTIPEELALEIVRVWLATGFAEGRHLNRIRQLEPSI